MIDIDNLVTYPIDIKEWIITIKPYFLKKISLNSYKHDYEIIHQLHDMRIEEQEFIQNYIQLNRETEFTMWHNARVYSKESYFKNGILSFNGDIQQAQRHKTNYTLHKERPYFPQGLSYLLVLNTFYSINR
jgi:hypothetical protein